MVGPQAFFLWDEPANSGNPSSPTFFPRPAAMSMPSMWGGSLGGDRTVEIPLSDDLITSFCRRSRRRFRELQESTEAQVKLDRNRGCLRVSGSEEAVAAVQRQLDSLTGPRIHVEAAVWAELMRTRTLQDSSLSAVAQLQEASGVRLHIERSRREIRLFGAADGVEVAEKILEELFARCVEVSVRCTERPEKFSEVLEAVANSCAVTIHVPQEETDGGEGLVTVLGQKASVHKAAEELRSYFADPENYQSSCYDKDASPPEVPLGVVTSKLPPLASSAADEEEKLLQQFDQQPRPGRRPKAQQAQQPQQQPNPVLQKQKMMQDQQQKQMQELQQDLQQLQQLQQHLQMQQQQCYQVGLPEAGDKDNAGGGESCRSCPTCGACRFCSSCGTQIWQYPQFQLPVATARPAMSLADWAMMNASARLPKVDDKGSGGGQMGTGTPDQEYPPAWSQAMNPMGGSTAGMYSGVPTGMMGVCIPANMMPGGSSTAGPGAPMQPCMMPTAMLPMMTPAGAESGLQHYTVPGPGNLGQLAGS